MEGGEVDRAQTEGAGTTHPAVHQPTRPLAAARMVGDKRTHPVGPPLGINTFMRLPPATAIAIGAGRPARQSVGWTVRVDACRVDRARDTACDAFVTVV